MASNQQFDFHQRHNPNAGLKRGGPLPVPPPYKPPAPVGGPAAYAPPPDASPHKMFASLQESMDQIPNYQHFSSSPLARRAHYTPTNIQAPGNLYTPQGPYAQNAYTAKDHSKTALPQYDAMRSRLNSHYSQTHGKAQDSLDRQFAAAGGGPGNGAQAKQTENLAAQIQAQKSQDLEGINLDESAARIRMQEMEDQKAYQSGEAQKGFAFQADQSDMGRRFQAAQNAAQLGMHADQFNADQGMKAHQFNSENDFKTDLYNSENQFKTHQFNTEAQQRHDQYKFENGSTLHKLDLAYKDFNQKGQIANRQIDQQTVEMRRDTWATAFNAAIEMQKKGDHRPLDQITNEILAKGQQKGLL